MDHSSESSAGNTVLLQTAPYSEVEMRVTYCNPENAHICPQCLEELASGTTPTTTTHYSWELPTEDEADENIRGSEDERDDDGDAHQEHHHLMKFILDVCEKFPESMRNHLNLEELIGVTKKKKKEKHHSKSKIKVTTTTRGGNGALDELFMKLEKFKVRTVIVDETSAEDQKTNT